MIKLLPSQIAEHWDLIRAGLLLSLPPIVEPTQEVMKNILLRLLCGDLQCWTVSEEDKLKGHMLTYISTDIHSKSKTLNIYSLHLHSRIHEQTWQGILDTLIKFGKADNCFRIASFTRLPNVISIAKRFGFNTDYHYIVRDI